MNESRDFDRMEPRDIKLEYLARGIHHARFSSGRREAADVIALTSRRFDVELEAGGGDGGGEGGARVGEQQKKRRLKRNGVKYIRHNDGAPGRNVSL